MKTTESVCSTPQILHIYKGKNTRWRKSTPIYPAYGVTSGISYGNIKRRQMALVPVFNSNLTTEGKGNKEFGLPWKSKQVSICQLLIVSLPLLVTPVTRTRKLTWDKQWIMTNFTTGVRCISVCKGDERERMKYWGERLSNQTMNITVCVPKTRQGSPCKFFLIREHSLITGIQQIPIYWVLMMCKALL